MTLGLYSLLLRLILPIALLRLYVRSFRAPEYRRRIGERLALGHPAPRADLWIHAVSVGEVQAAELLIRRLRGRDPALRILVTTTTPTGAARLQDLCGDRVEHRYTPYDLPGVMRRFLVQVRPSLVVVVETEIWPNMLAACEPRGIPVMLANARLSARSARGYARLARLTGETLRRFSRIAAQTEADAQRFVGLGAEPKRVQVTGSIKFDLHQPASRRELAETLRRAWGIQRPVWVAASTHEGEEGPLLEAHRRVLERLPNALLVLVPRHPERFGRVAVLVERYGFAMVRRSHHEPCREDTAVLLGDTMGELAAFLAAGDAAFIGGSLVPTGGHNLLEAAAAGVPMVVGPHTFNFAQITAMMVEEGAAARVADAAELAEVMSSWLSDAALRAQVGEQGRVVVERNRGALDRLMAVLDAGVEAGEPGPSAI
ncbi:3-deoxy-D-manno-octulosonic acid transferase [Thiorhodococcus mannitoliphagus]|uniref:3-deoxy-D-manno-octulosonic acid transferase n=1 Tax=Thiorhodococcus mannitoliphagus TaxID=329406 RepID=A0A6P1DQG3_9GAMM|nr:lipid IV(A) 3-deoxy-D-manno-octulosonic acid transferase [Thiorhodococcus mannitoliphagus]NEX19393.1 3-deoxy-D-manno-octulosonic acid transferase [Thiorhodococcus mannitoliphagus]